MKGMTPQKHIVPRLHVMLSILFLFVGIITITDRLSSNLFPSSLLPLISFVISTLNHWPSSRHVSGTESATETTTTSEGNDTGHHCQQALGHMMCVFILNSFSSSRGSSVAVYGGQPSALLCSPAASVQHCLPTNQETRVH